MVETFKSSKLFYGKYPFKIAYKRLYGFPNTEILNTRWGLNPHFQWWFDLPEGDGDRKRRDNCYRFLNGFKDVKYNNSSLTHVYFPTREDFERAKKRYKELHEEYHEPFIDNLVEVMDKYTSKVELKKGLYHKKYRYKVTFRFNDYFEAKLGRDLYEMYKDNTNYYLNPNVKRFDPVNIPTRSPTYGTYGYKWRHSPYNLYAIYCLEKIDMEMLTFVASENIGVITKAVLIEELDK